MAAFDGLNMNTEGTTNGASKLDQGAGAVTAAGAQLRDKIPDTTLLQTPTFGSVAGFNQAVQNNLNKAATVVDQAAKGLQAYGSIARAGVSNYFGADDAGRTALNDAINRR